MVPQDKLENLRRSIEELGIIHLHDIPRDEEVEDLIFSGKSLREINNAAVKKCIKDMMDKLMCVSLKF
jgi:hypothetical protein